MRAHSAGAKPAQTDNWIDFAIGSLPIGDKNEVDRADRMRRTLILGPALRAHPLFPLFRDGR